MKWKTRKVLQATPKRSRRIKHARSYIKEQVQDFTALGHRVAEVASENGWGYSQNTTGDSVSRWDRQQLVSLARRMDDENIFFSSILDRMVSNLIGPKGFSLQARTGNPEFNAQIEKAWKAWGHNPEYRDTLDWVQLQQGVARDVLSVGDLGFIKLRQGQLQAVEGEYINPPNNSQLQQLKDGRKVEQGVEMLTGGKVIAYWVTPPTPGGYGLNNAKGTRIAKRDFIYVNGKFQRFSRSRPLPPFIQAMSCIWRLDDILNSEAIAWQLLAKHAIAVTKAGAEVDAYDESEPDSRSDSQTAPIADRFTDHPSALVFWGEEGEEVRGIDRNLPGKDFPASMRAVIQLFAMKVGLPLETMLLDWSQTNFSSGRGALTQGELTILAWQALLAAQFHIPTYEWKLRQWLTSGELVAPEGLDTDDIFKHEWFPPAPPWIDPKEEAESWGIRVDRGQATYTDSLKARGKDPEEELRRREDDMIRAIESRDRIFKKTGVDVGWERQCGYLIGKTQSAEKEARSIGDDKPETQPEIKPDAK